MRAPLSPSAFGRASCNVKTVGLFIDGGGGGGGVKLAAAHHLVSAVSARPALDSL
jgi:hypothetical protein